MRVEALAMRWYVAREERLARQRALKPPRYAPELERARAEAKRIETRALWELAKECAKARLSQEGVPDAERKPRLPTADFIDV